MAEQVKYLSYGTPIGLPAGDGDCDGDWDDNDRTVIANWTTGYDIRYDANLDGVIDADDITYANSITGAFHTMGFGVLSSPAVFNRSGYAGYEHAAELTGTKWHVRYRVLDSELGRWTRRDPLGYVDGMNLLAYVAVGLIASSDPFGLLAMSCACSLFSWPSVPNNAYGNPACCRALTENELGVVNPQECQACCARTATTCHLLSPDWNDSCLAHCGSTPQSHIPVDPFCPPDPDPILPPGWQIPAVETPWDPWSLVPKPIRCIRPLVPYLEHPIPLLEHCYNTWEYSFESGTFQLVLKCRFTF